jgi:hypothetical protein
MAACPSGWRLDAQATGRLWLRPNGSGRPIRPASERYGRRLYGRARSALISEMQNAEPPIPRSEIMVAQMALEAATEELEADAGPEPVNAPRGKFEDRRRQSPRSTISSGRRHSPTISRTSSSMPRNSTAGWGRPACTMSAAASDTWSVAASCRPTSSPSSRVTPSGATPRAIPIRCG